MAYSQYEFPCATSAFTIAIVMSQLLMGGRTMRILYIAVVLLSVCHSVFAQAPIRTTPAEEACLSREDRDACLAELRIKDRATERLHCVESYGEKECAESEATEAESLVLRQQVAELYGSMMKNTNDYYRRYLEESQRSWGKYIGAECTSRMRDGVENEKIYMHAFNKCINEHHSFANGRTATSNLQDPWKL